MPFPYEDATHENSVDEVRAFLDEHHPAQYLVFNLSGHSYDTMKLHNMVRPALYRKLRGIGDTVSSMLLGKRVQ